MHCRMLACGSFSLTPLQFAVAPPSHGFDQSLERQVPFGDCGMEYPTSTVGIIMGHLICNMMYCNIYCRVISSVTFDCHCNYPDQRKKECNATPVALCVQEWARHG